MKFGIDMAKAKEIHKTNIRVAREPKLAALDIEFQRALEASADTSAIVAKKQAIPNNFTVFTAAAGDQTAKPLEEAKHGLFSYFLMKGMEGEADRNNDNTITVGELHAYVQQNVIQQSSGSQTPELQGDANRVLVQFQ